MRRLGNAGRIKNIFIPKKSQGVNKKRNAAFDLHLGIVAKFISRFGDVGASYGDIAGLKRDKAALDRAIGEMKKAVDDVSGDIAGIGDDLVVLVPSGIKIDRDKVVGGRD